ncbi:MAG: ester cyclase [Myxococcota bacterium]
MSDIQEQDRHMNELVANGKVMEAFEEYLTEDVVMQDNDDEPTVGKDANRQREQEFFESVDEIHAFDLLDQGTGDDVSYSTWHLDITFTNGQRGEWTQIEKREWRDGKVNRVQFFHNFG